MEERTIELLKRFNDLKDIFEHLYFYHKVDEKDGNSLRPKALKGHLYPYRYLEMSCGIEVEVNIATAKYDVRRDEDEYLHALSYACIPLAYHNPECELSVLFHDAYTKELFKRKMYFEDCKKYIYPYRVFEKGEGKLRGFISTSFSEESFFSYEFFLTKIYAYRNKEDMYLVYRGKTLIKEEEFKDFASRVEKDFKKLEKIYLRYYEEVVSRIYIEADKELESYLRLSDIVHNIKPLSEEDINEIAFLVESNEKLKQEYQSFMNKDNVASYVERYFAKDL